MKIENKIINLLHYSELSNSEPIHICNSIIKTIDFDTFEFNSKVVIERCMIDSLLVHSCWFRKGLVFKNNHLINYVDYQMGGHNFNPIQIENNIFVGFVNFFDCQFEEVVEINNNIFIKGSNLLGNKGEGFENSFDKGVMYNNNIGQIDLEGFGEASQE